MKASENGHDKCITGLINEGADVNKSGGRSLTLAAKGGHEKCIEVLINAGVNANIKSKKRTTALMNAALHGNLQCVNTLIKVGADVNKTSTKGYTALGYAVAGDRFLKSGATISSRHIDCVMKLLDAEADVNTFGEKAASPLIHSLYYEEEALDVVGILLKAGADVNRPD